MADSGKVNEGGKDYAEKLDRLLKFLYDPEENHIEAVRENLARYGIDPNELVSEGLSLVKSLEKQERTKLARMKRRKLAEVFDKLRKIDPQRPIDEVRRRIDEIFKTADGSQSALAFFHKHEDLSDDDLRNLLSEAELLKLLEEEKKRLETSEE
jgi:hypothetical protein